jgi:tripartite-type tricarboxylate transporter receptor subunit TctC
VNKRRILLVAAWAVLPITTAVAAEYPDHPIRFIVPSAPGGAPDVNARLIAAELTKQMGKQIVVDNRAGASGILGMEMIARAVPDGYTIGFGTISALAINPSVLAKLPYDPDKDLQRVVQVGFTSGLLAVTPALPIRSVKELIDYARDNPGKLSYGSSGSGSVEHLGMELFKLRTGTQIVHVPYKAIQQAITEMSAGLVQLTIANMTAILPQVKSGRLRGLGVTSPKRSTTVPELPTVAEAGVPGFEVTFWSGVVVPAGVPKTIVANLNAEINKALVSPTLKEKYAAMDYEPVGGTPEQFAELVKKETVKWADIVKRTGAKVD